MDLIRKVERNHPETDLIAFWPFSLILLVSHPSLFCFHQNFLGGAK